MADDFHGAEQRGKSRLTDEEISWIRDEISDEKARSRLAIKLRNALTLLMLVIASYTLFWDKFKSLVQALGKQ